MARPRNAPTEEDLAPMREQITAWRAVRRTRDPMPEELWAHAVALAQAHGACPIARAFGLDYKSLKTRMAKAAEPNGLVRPTFVELPATRASAPVAVPTIEITAADGSRMCIRLEAGHGREAARIVAAFLGNRG